MRARWTHLCGNNDATTVDALYEIVETMYRRPGHHTLRHVAECLDLFAEVGDIPAESEAMEFAIWLHDIIYIPGRTDNEERSLIVANMMLQELGKGWMIGLVWGMIRATMHSHSAETKAEALMADIDLSILGSDPTRYDEYARHIRQEFSSVASKLYRTGRTDVLEGFLGRGRIFSTPIIGTRFEVQARENMAREIKALAHG